MNKHLISEIILNIVNIFAKHLIYEPIIFMIVMKHLIIFAHPSNKSFNHSVLEAIAEESLNQNHEIKIRNLYEQKFNAILSTEDLYNQISEKNSSDVAEEQELILWANSISFIFPLWWSGFPAILKGYFDRVYTKGFAFKNTPNGVIGLLTNKKVFLYTTTGTPMDKHIQQNDIEMLNHNMTQGIFGFCGMKVMNHEIFAGVSSTTANTRKAMLERIKNVVGEMKI